MGTSSMSKGSRGRRIIKEIGNSLIYMYKSLSFSMRRRISFDYMVMYLIVSVITLVVFTMGYNLIRIGEAKEAMVDQVFNLALLRDKGDLSETSFAQQIELLGKEASMGISITMAPVTGHREPYKVYGSYVNPQIYEMRYIENLWLFFGKGMVNQSNRRQFTFTEGDRVNYDIRIVQNFRQPTKERHVLMIAIMVSQIIGITIMSIVGSYRLRRVFQPVFAMTKAAETITINTMDARLDVDKAEYELKDLARTFNDMIEGIREDYVKQKRFVSDVSHELRTPISIVSGYARMLDRWGKTDEAILEESIEAIKGESRNMQVLVENLLTLVRSDNQTLEFEKDSFDIAKLGEELIRDCILIDEERHTFEADLDKRINVCLDEAKTKQTIRIFLDNAIKYTPEGGHVKLSMQRLDEQVEVTVSDTGIGIAKEDLPHLFERFYRSDESRTRETGGHGLGLAIAKAMVIGQGGIIRVKSKINEGSSFIITLPIRCEES